MEYGKQKQPLWQSPHVRAAGELGTALVAGLVIGIMAGHAVRERAHFLERSPAPIVLRPIAPVLKEKEPEVFLIIPDVPLVEPPMQQEPTPIALVPIAPPPIQHKDVALRPAAPSPTPVPAPAPTTVEEHAPIAQPILEVIPPTKDEAIIPQEPTPVVEEPVTPEQVIPEEQEKSVEDTFPAFERAVHPVHRIPNWGAMRTPDVWNRTYSEMAKEDFVAVPAYNLDVLTTPMENIKDRSTPEKVAMVTAKLYYSTRFFGTYDLDSGEHTGKHNGVDLKLAKGTPIGAIGGGRVIEAGSDKILGTHVVIEHHVNGHVFHSTYGHLGTLAVEVGQDVTPGTVVGTVGMTGKTYGPHLHLQVDAVGEMAPDGMHAAGETPEAVNPISFIGKY